MAMELWNGLNRSRKTGVVALAAVELVLTSVALKDLIRRPSAQVRGPKLVWFAACLVQPFGPPAYLRLGRRLPR